MISRASTVSGATESNSAAKSGVVMLGTVSRYPRATGIVSTGASGSTIAVMLGGARSILRINIIQHDACDTSSEWNHSRNFVGRAFNWIMCNNGYHTIHHNRAGLHWSVLHEWHAREVKPRITPSLDEPSMVLYLVRTYLFHAARPVRPDVGRAEVGAAPVECVPLLGKVFHLFEFVVGDAAVFSLGLVGEGFDLRRDCAPLFLQNLYGFHCKILF